VSEPINDFRQRNRQGTITLLLSSTQKRKKTRSGKRKGGSSLSSSAKIVDESKTIEEVFFLGTFLKIRSMKMHI